MFGKPTRRRFQAVRFRGADRYDAMKAFHISLKLPPSFSGEQDMQTIQYTSEVKGESKAVLQRLADETRVQAGLSALRGGDSWGRKAPLNSRMLAVANPYLEKVNQVLESVNGGITPSAAVPTEVPSQLGPWPTGSITFDNGIPVGGWASLALFQNGDFQFYGHYHVSGSPSYNVEHGWVVLSSTGYAFTFKASGHLAGTLEPGSRDYDWNNTANHPDIAQHWPDLMNGWSYRWSAAVGWDAISLVNSIVEVMKVAGTVITAVIAIV